MLRGSHNNGKCYSCLIFDAAAFKTITGMGIVIESNPRSYARKNQEVLAKVKDGMVSTGKQPEREKNKRYDPMCGMGCPGN